MNYPPPWMDISTLCEHICVCDATVDTWVKQSILPAPRMRGGKRMWKWAEVDLYLENGLVVVAGSSQTEDICNATKAASRKNS